MQKVAFFNTQLPVVEDFNHAQDKTANGIKSRVVDRVSWGILRSNEFISELVLPVSGASPTPNLRLKNLEFPVSLDTNTGLVGVGIGASQITSPMIAGGIACDLNGDSISVLTDEDFDFSTSAPYGQKSSGNRNIPTNAGVTSGNASTVPCVPGAYYIWIEYLETTDPSVVRIGNNSSVNYPEKLDGYKIRVTDVPVSPSGDGVSIFCAKVQWTPGFTGILTATRELVSNGSGANYVDPFPEGVNEPARVYSMVRDSQIEIVVSTSHKTTTYSDNSRMDLSQHVNALGSGAPTPNNPHALTMKDIPGAGAEPVAEINQKESLAKGIVDFNVPQNSPNLPAEALLPTIENGNLSITTALDPNAINGLNINDLVKDAWVRVGDLNSITPNKERSVFLGGKRIKRLYPTLRDTNLATDPSIIATDPDTGDGWVGFDRITESTVGIYRIFGVWRQLTDSETDVLVVSKEVIASGNQWPNPVPELTDEKLLIGYVYWDPSNPSAPVLYRNQSMPPSSDPGNQPDDKRSLGLVGPQQLSTELKNDPQTGALKEHVNENLVANSSYAFGVATGNGLTWVDTGAVPYVADTSGITSLAIAADTTMGYGEDESPGALTSIQVTCNSGAVSASSKLYHDILSVKPNTHYAISFWAKATSNFLTRMRVGLSSTKNSTPNSIMSSDFVDMTIRNDGFWHRYSVIVSTTQSIDPRNAAYLLIEFAKGVASILGGTLKMTNVSVTEGEWISGYKKSKSSVPCIKMYDDRAVCPAGEVEVTAMRNRFPVGAGTVAVGAGAGAIAPSGSTVTSTGAGGHDHSIPTLTTNATNAGGGIGEYFDQVGVAAKAQHYHTTQSNTTGSVGTHTHDTVAPVAPYYGVLYCKELG
jgi:hypothetical protein